MCTRLELRMASRELRRLMPGGQWLRQDLPRAGEIHAEGCAPMLVAEGSGEHRTARWGLVGSFLDHPPRQPLLHLPAQGLSTRPFYSRLFRQRRCLVPATAFIAGKTRSGQEVRVQPASGGLLLLAGVWDEHPGVGVSFALLTVLAPGLLAAGGGCVPLVLGAADSANWLADDDALGEEALSEFSRQMASTRWHSELLPLPEVSPQLAFRFA